MSITHPRRRGLRKHGFGTAIATDGSEALEMANAGTFNLMLLDLGLPVQKIPRDKVTYIYIL
ncbi:MAG TPA: hypothetical protein IGS17_15035 [Oscillatoriales cyanobacterium M59_W2019_021]|nr:hypothetical protein [Oscillatoriales cyanobacterium M59_W2019_021]